MKNLNDRDSVYNIKFGIYTVRNELNELNGIFIDLGYLLNTGFVMVAIALGKDLLLLWASSLITGNFSFNFNFFDNCFSVLNYLDPLFKIS